MKLFNKIKNSLISQGYEFKNNRFILNTDLRKVHQKQTLSKVHKNIKFLKSNVPNIICNIDIKKVQPRIVEVKSNTDLYKQFKWWNIAWWSLPYEKSFGRQIRLFVWDDYHNAPMGIIGLQSPILSWSVRDKYLGIKAIDRDIVVNQSLNAQRLGSLPPYNQYLGGKLVAMLMVSNTVRKIYEEKYKDYQTLILNRKIPSRLLFITTTGAYGKTPVYNRLNICKFIGWSKGAGSFHIPDDIYEEMILYLKNKGENAGRCFNFGPSRKIKNITKCMNLLGIKAGANHGIKRSVYLFPFVKNLKETINNEEPIWIDKNEDELIDNWKKRWLVKRINKKCYLNFPFLQ